MALTQVTTSGLANGAVTSSKINASVQLGGPTISQIQITDSSYNVLDDTAVSTSGGYIKITGTGFAAGAIVVIGSTNATSTGFVSSTVLNVQVPALSAGTYTVYVVNSNGGTAIGVNGLTYSAEPNWVTSSTLPNGTSGSAISIQLDATEATTYTLQAGSTLPTGLTLTSGGLLSGTVTVGIETIYSFTVVATDAQSQDSPRAFTITITSGDPYFYLTTMLLPGNGTNNGTNNTFIDGSTNNFTITRYGNTTQGTFSPFSQTGWGNYFDGSGDGISFGNNANTNPSSSDITVEAWVFPLAYNSYGPIFSNDINGGFHFGRIASGFGVRHYGTGDVISYATTPTLNQWTHVAVSRSGNTWYLFYNGTQVATATASNTFTQGTACVGGNPSTASEAWNGYLSNVRFIKGTALYTSNFTPSTTPLTAVSNTQLLTCQNNRFVDNSANAYAVTVFGTPSAQAFSPFNPTAAWSAATNGGSGYFDGTGDALTLPSNSALAPGAGDFTLEAWVYYPGSANLYPDILSNSGVIIAFLPNDRSSVYNSIFSDDNYPGSGNATLLSATGTIPKNAWAHLAWVRSGSTITAYINGVASGTATSSTNHTREMQVIGAIAQGGAPNVYFWNGYISNFRLVKGTAVYTSNFTPPTAPVTAIANTSVLCNFTNGQITDATSKNILETVGDAKISTAQSKWGGSSMYFDGTGDAVRAFSSSYTSPQLSFGNGNFTIEAWVYFNNVSSRGAIFNQGWGVGSYTTNGGFTLDIAGENAGQLALALGTMAPGSFWIRGGSFSINTWYHIAMVRNGTSIIIYKDGVSTVSGTLTSSSTLVGNMGFFTAGAYTDNTLPFNGYMDDLRITKGYARYTTNFTPPTSAFQTT